MLISNNSNNTVYNFCKHKIENFMTNYEAFECLSCTGFLNTNFNNYDNSISYLKYLLEILPYIFGNQSAADKCLKYITRISNGNKNMRNNRLVLPQNTYNNYSQTNIQYNIYNNFPSNSYGSSSYNPSMYNNQSSFTYNGNLNRNVNYPISNSTNTVGNNFSTTIQNVPQSLLDITTYPTPPQTTFMRGQSSTRLPNCPPSYHSSVNNSNSIVRKVSQPKIIQKKLFYYNEIKEICSWNQNCKISMIPVVRGREVTNKYYEYAFEISISSTILSCIKKPKNNQSFDILLRSVSRPDKDGLYSDQYPLDMEFFTENINCSDLLPRVEAKYASTDIGQRLSYPSIITPAIINKSKSFPLVEGGLECFYTFHFRIRYPTFAKRQSMIENGFYFFKFVFCSKIPTETVMNRILKQPMLGKEAFLKNIIEEFERDDEIGCESVIVSLQSSITMAIIKHPFRGKYCKHLIPDDLEAYLKQNEGNEKFVCKICKNKCTPDDIIIDSYFREILEKNSKITKIEILKNGEYIIKEIEDDEIDKDNKFSNNHLDIDEIIIIESGSEDENESNVTKNLKSLPKNETLISNQESFTNVVSNKTLQQDSAKSNNISKINNVHTLNECGDNLVIDESRENVITPISNEIENIVISDEMGDDLVIDESIETDITPISKEVENIFISSEPMEIENNFIPSEVLEVEDVSSFNKPKEVSKIIISDKPIQQIKFTNKNKSTISSEANITPENKLSNLCIDRSINGTKNGVSVDIDVDTSGGVVINDSDGNTKNNNGQINKSLTHTCTKIYDKDILIPKNKNSKTNSTAINSQSIFEINDFEELDINKFKISKEYIELNKSRFKFDIDPGDFLF
ncbi:Zinc finger, MIZ-type domain-containing protein [Strongyloides ratti]|uniref:Zinc finger, MIZ-type domain-containing protein n=1 Tax=Strongyloides ratti TaxID=34506 RepID=A0A090L1F7_STRRB|nr:Zinc finger, MIZ-type domain-containing protein [Strongyloides ratti]CEF63621.1 Zinc finger, MIZ-type domain-containing protein [Strongyloides ratti]